MTCPAFRTLATIARQLADLALFLAHPVAGWTAAADELYLRATRPRDGAQRLADKEAEEEVAEPGMPPLADDRAAMMLGIVPDKRTPGERLWDAVRLGVADDPNEPSTFRSGGQTSTYGPRPHISTPGPRVTDSDRLDTVIALLEDVRNLLQSDGRGHGKDGGQRAEWSSGADFPSSPPSPSQTSSPATGHGHPEIPDYPTANHVNPGCLRSAACAIDAWMSGKSFPDFAVSYWVNVFKELHRYADALEPPK